MRIGGVDLDERVLVVAEIGNNHEGSYGLAEELVGLAANAGVDAVKFQTITPSKLVNRADTARLEQLGRFCLSMDQFRSLAKVAEQAGVLFMSTPFDVDAVAELDPIVPGFKVASGDNTLAPLLRAVAETRKPIILSAGAATLEEVEGAVATVRETWGDDNPGIALLHCVVSYPTAPADANLAVMRELEGIGDAIGWSDHTLGSTAAVAAVAMGARVIEKHFTIANDHSAFRDHQLSANPATMAHLVRSIREVEELLGTGPKRVLPCEEATQQAVRRSIAASRDLPAGTVIALGDLTWLRPATGIPAGREDDVVGRTLKVDVEAGALLDADLLT